VFGVSLSLHIDCYQIMKMLMDKANEQDSQLANLQRKMRQFTKVETDMHDARMASEQFSKEVKVLFM